MSSSKIRFLFPISDIIWVSREIYSLSQYIMFHSILMPIISRNLEYWNNGYLSREQRYNTNTIHLEMEKVMDVEMEVNVDVYCDVCNPLHPVLLLLKKIFILIPILPNITKLIMTSWLSEKCEMVGRQFGSIVDCNLSFNNCSYISYLLMSHQKNK